ncbi:hypothetical protein ES703_101916 [subsurface metagenome]
MEKEFEDIEAIEELDKYDAEAHEACYPRY